MRVHEYIGDISNGGKSEPSNPVVLVKEVLYIFLLISQLWKYNERIA